MQPSGTLQAHDAVMPPCDHSADVAHNAVAVAELGKPMKRDIDMTANDGDLKLCKSCSQKKPSLAFSGMATCDRCRIKKRKKSANAEESKKQLSDENHKLLTENQSLKQQLHDARDELAKHVAEIERLRAAASPNQSSADRPMVWTEQPSALHSPQRANDDRSQSLDDQFDCGPIDTAVQEGENCARLSTEDEPVRSLSDSLPLSDPSNSASPREITQQQFSQPCWSLEVEQHQLAPSEEQWLQTGISNTCENLSNAAPTDRSLLEQPFDLGSFPFLNLPEEMAEGSSGSFPGFGKGSAAATTDADDVEPVDGLCSDMQSYLGLTRYNYVRSLKYSIYFEDPELETAFQEQMTIQRRARMWVGFFALGAISVFGEASICWLMPHDYSFRLWPRHLFAFAGVLGALFVWSLTWDLRTSNKKKLQQTRHLSELGFYLMSGRHLWFIISKCYGDVAPATEDWMIITITICMISINVAWQEVSPFGAAATVGPLWGSLLLVPNVSMVFRVRAFGLAGFFWWLAFVVYQNNREMFVNQVKLQHAHLITAELKQEQQEHEQNTKENDKKVAS